MTALLKFCYSSFAWRVIFSAICLAIISGCAHEVSPQFKDDPWKQNILDYEASLPANHPDLVNNLFVIDNTIKQQVRSQFSSGPNYQRAEDLARWLIDVDGHDMVYDVNANFPPNDAFHQKRGNCLSFTILLISLANDLGIELQYNDVDLPNMWELDEQAGLMFYRHVNAVYRSAMRKQVFDLAMSEYDSGYPQRIISQRDAAAMLHSNLGIEAFKEMDQQRAFHHLKLAASISPSMSFVWINLGAAYKRFEQLDNAEKAFKVALSIDDKNGLASSNLERVYRLRGKIKLAREFSKKAARARFNNPYLQYQNAWSSLQKGEFRSARKSISRAIKLHSKDPKFFELSSELYVHKKQYRKALLEIGKAFKLSDSQEQRTHYQKKIDNIVETAEKEAEEHKRLQRKALDSTIFRDQSGLQPPF